MRRLSHLVAAAAVLVWAPLAWADDSVEFITDDGKTQTVRGNIREETEREVVVQTSTAQRRIPVYQITEVRYDQQPAELINVRSKFTQGRFEEVVTDLRNIGKSLGASASPNLQQTLAFQIFAAQAELAIQDPSKSADALKWYADYGDSFARTRHYFPIQEYLGRIYLAGKEYAKADQAFQNLEQVDWPGYKERATNYRGIAALKQNQSDAALKLFDDVVNASGEAQALKEQQLLAKVYKAKALVGLSKAKEAEDLVRQTLNEIPAENTTAKAIGRNTLGDALRAQNKNPKEVMLEGYMWVFAVYNKDPDELAYALFNLVDLFTQLKQPERAQEMAQTLRNNFPSSEWTQKLTGG
jgi:tetratricopeptide (TPR) repeat protein